jgi:antitoxin (DNA-binding transcriptional repressor) of toxin-antitoxin stability system
VLIHNLKPSDEVVITDNDQPVARLAQAAERQQAPRCPGTLRGTMK